MAQAKELQKRFSERFDALRCAELLKKKFIPDDTTPSAKVLQLTGHCDIMIVTAVEIVEEMLQELKGEALPDHIKAKMKADRDKAKLEAYHKQCPCWNSHNDSCYDDNCSCDRDCEYMKSFN